MKHLLNGVAIAAALAIASPVWAQAPAAPSAPTTKAPAATKPAPHKAMAKQMHHRRPVRRMARRAHMKVSPGERMTEQLNREELARIQGGAPTPPGPPSVSSQTPYGKGGQPQ